MTRYAKPNVLSVQQQTDLLIPLTNALDAWLKLYSHLMAVLTEGVHNGILSYDRDLEGTDLASFNKLAFDLGELRRMLTAIERTVTIPTPEPFVPPPITPTDEIVPDNIESLRKEVANILLAVKGEKPTAPEFFPELSWSKGLQDLYDDIVHTKWFDVAGQIAIGAKTGFMAAITTIFGSTTFAAFMYEEAVQALGMPGWIAYNAKQYGIAFQAFKAQDELIRDADKAVDLWRPLMPLTYPGFRAFFDAARTANDQWFGVLEEAMIKAGLPAPPTLAVLSKPSGAEIYIDDKDTLTLTPETFKWLAPGTHSIVAIIPATATKAEIGAAAEVTLIAGKKLEVSLVLEALAEAELPPPPVTAPATLRVSSSPSEGEIYIDGVDTGTLTPETFKALAPGRHTVLVVVPPRGAWPRREATITLTLAPGEKREISLSPTIP